MPQVIVVQLILVALSGYGISGITLLICSMIVKGDAGNFFKICQNNPILWHNIKASELKLLK